MKIMNKMMENIRKLYTEHILFYYIGSFYKCFGRDAYIVSYLFGYKTTYIKQEISIVGFPKKDISKVYVRNNFKAKADIPLVIELAKCLHHLD